MDQAQNIKLTILIPTIPRRKEMFDRLRGELLKQEPNLVLIMSDPEIGINTGAKRNRLLERANTEYIVFIDDDDEIAPTYIQDILAAIEQGPDVVTFDGRMTTNGGAEVKWHIRLGEKYEERGGRYYRFPNHLCPMKRELAIQVKFPDISQGEDYAFAKQMNDLGLLKTEVVIEKELYHYKFITNK